MEICFKELRANERLDIDGNALAMALVSGSGRGSSVTINADQHLVLALRGDLHLETPDGAMDLAPGRLLMGNPGRLRLVARHPSLWLALSGSTDAWRELLLRVIPSVDDREPMFYPHSGACPGALKRAFVRLARQSRRKLPANGLRSSLGDIFANMWELQREIDELNTNCSGRTASQRRQNLYRLIRARHRILMNPAMRLELPVLAAGANYSPWHFIRTFRRVFGEAPCQYGMRVRLEHAHRLVHNSQLTISEVADAVGYDSRSAFCRSFRQAYGMTASDARRRFPDPDTSRQAGLA